MSDIGGTRPRFPVDLSGVGAGYLKHAAVLAALGWTGSLAAYQLSRRSTERTLEGVFASGILMDLLVVASIFAFILAAVLAGRWSAARSYMRCGLVLEAAAARIVANDFGRPVPQDGEGPLSGLAAKLELIRIGAEAREAARLRSTLEGGKPSGAGDHRLTGGFCWEMGEGSADFSPICDELLGLPQGGLGADSSTFVALAHPDDRAALTARMASCDAPDLNVSLELRLRYSTGFYRWFEWNGRTATSDDGAGILLVGSLRDVHDQHLAAARSAARAVEATRSSKELDRFARVAAHDLKSPLRTIHELANWLEEDLSDVIDGESSEHLDLIRSRASGLIRLLDDIAKYSNTARRIEGLEAVNAGDVVRRALAKQERASDFELALDDLPVFQTDLAALTVVVDNLIENAIHHHDRGKGSIRVGCVDRGAYYEFSVSDDGPGVPAEYHDQIFAVLSSLDARGKKRGSGMGLAIACKQVEYFGGHVSVLSDPEQRRGATFRFTWPKDLSYMTVDTERQSDESAGYLNG